MALQCRIVHAIAGRTRLRVPALRRHISLATQMASYLCDQAGILTVSVTPACDSIVVHADPARWSAGALSRFITDLSPDTVSTYFTQHPPAPQPLPAPEAPWLALGVSSLAVTACLIAEPVAPLLVPLLIGSAWPIFSRARAALAQRHPGTADVADATATTLLALQGQWLAAAGLVWLVHLTDALGDTARTRASQTLEDAVATAPQRAWLRQQRVEALAETQAQHEAEQWAEALLPGRAAMAGAVGLATGDLAQSATVLMVGHSAGMRGAAPTTAQVPHVVLSEAALEQIPLAIGMARDSRRLVQQHWQVITVANTFAFGLASFGLIGPLGALMLSKGAALAVLGRALYAAQT